MQFYHILIFNGNKIAQTARSSNKLTVLIFIFWTKITLAVKTLLRVAKKRPLVSQVQKAIFTGYPCNVSRRTEDQLKFKSVSQVIVISRAPLGRDPLAFLALTSHNSQRNVAEFARITQESDNRELSRFSVASWRTIIWDCLAIFEADSQFLYSQQLNWRSGARNTRKELFLCCSWVPLQLPPKADNTSLSPRLSAMIIALLN